MKPNMKIIDSMKRITFLFAAALLLCGCGGSNITRQVLFMNPDAESIPYRIPAIAACNDGSLVALADYRHCRSDIGFGRVDLRCRLSDDNGKSWGKEITVIEGNGISGSTDCGFGDPAVVCDSETGEILLLSVRGETIYWKASTNRQNPNRVAAFRSFDKGRSWSAPQDVTEDIYSLFDSCQAGCVESCFVGSGRIFQSRYIKTGSHYRIYAALCARPNGNRVIYSDDFGHTWKALGGADALPAPGGNEPKCEELADGSVVLSSRAEGGRIFNIYRYSDTVSGEGTWGEAEFSGAGNNGCTALENACNGEILIVPSVRTDDKTSVSLALQSVPLGKGRSNVGIYFKELPADAGSVTPASFASGWEGPYQVSYTSSAYSTMVLQSDGRIAFFYEETLNADETGYDLVYTALPVPVITSGKYK